MTCRIRFRRAALDVAVEWSLQELLGLLETRRGGWVDKIMKFVLRRSGTQ